MAFLAVTLRLKGQGHTKIIKKWPLDHSGIIFTFLKKLEIFDCDLEIDLWPWTLTFKGQEVSNLVDDVLEY